MKSTCMAVPSFSSTFVILTLLSPIIFCSGLDVASFGHIGPDQIEYILIENCNEYQGIKIAAQSTAPLRVLINYGSVPTTTSFDAEFEMTISTVPSICQEGLPCLVIGNVLNQVQPRNIARAATGNIYIGIWGGLPLSSKHYFSGPQVLQPYEVLVSKQEWQSFPTSDVEFQPNSASTSVCQQRRSLLMGIKKAPHAYSDASLFDFKITGIPEVVVLNLTVLVLTPFNSQGVEACFSPTQLSYAPLAPLVEVCNPGVANRFLKRINGSNVLVTKLSFLFTAIRPMEAPGWALTLRSLTGQPFMMQTQLSLCTEALYCESGHFASDVPIFSHRLASIPISYFGDLSTITAPGKNLICPITEIHAAQAVNDVLELGMNFSVAALYDMTYARRITATRSTPLYLSMETPNMNFYGTQSELSISVYDAPTWTLLDFEVTVYPENLPAARTNASLGFYSINSQHQQADSILLDSSYPMLGFPSKTFLKIDLNSQASFSGKVIVEMSWKFFLCSEKMCPSSRGTCSIKTSTNSFAYGSCDCRYGYGGEECADVVVPLATRTAQALMLELSNITMGFAIWLAYRRNCLGLSSMLLFTMVFSTIYHLCDQQIYCLLNLKYLTLQKLDFFLTFMDILLVSRYLSYVPVTFDGTLLAFQTLLAFLISQEDGLIGLVFIFVLSGVLVVFTLGVEYYRRFKTVSAEQRMLTQRKLLRLISDDIAKEWNFWFLGAAVPFLVTAIVVMNKQDSSNYWVMHGNWHISIMMTVAFLILSRKKKAEVKAPGELQLHHKPPRIPLPRRLSTSLTDQVSRFKRKAMWKHLNCSKAMMNVNSDATRNDDSNDVEQGPKPATFILVKRSRSRNSSRVSMDTTNSPSSMSTEDRLEIFGSICLRAVDKKKSDSTSCSSIRLPGEEGESRDSEGPAS